MTTHIAMMIPTTSMLYKWKHFTECMFYSIFLKYFFDTYDKEYQYTFYLGIDNDDAFYHSPNVINDLISYIRDKCSNVKVKFIEFNSSEDTYVRKGHLTRMWNIIFKQAYDDGCEYFFQCGDDIQQNASGWIKECICTLNMHNGIGIASPQNITGDVKDLLTQTFVTRKHMDIFGYFFPEEIVNWHCDDWINCVYAPLHKYTLENHSYNNIGGKQRYTIISGKEIYEKLVSRDKIKLNQHIDTIQLAQAKLFADPSLNLHSNIDVFIIGKNVISDHIISKYSLNIILKKSLSEIDYMNNRNTVCIIFEEQINTKLVDRKWERLFDNCQDVFTNYGAKIYFPNVGDLRYTQTYHDKTYFKVNNIINVNDLSIVFIRANSQNLDIICDQSIMIERTVTTIQLPQSIQLPPSIPDKQDINIKIGSDGMGRWSKELIDYVLNLAYPCMSYNMTIQWLDQQSDEIPDLLICSHFTNQEPEKKYNKNIPYIYWSGETWKIVYNKSYLPIVTLQTMQDIDNAYHNFYHLPLIVLYFDYQKYIKNNCQIRLRTGNARPNFVAYCNSAVVEEREHLFRLLKSSGKYGADGLGGCQPTHGKRIPKGTSHDAMAMMLSEYRFVFAMENKCSPGYLTEKLLHAFMSGGIPIYWGDSEYAKTIFNARAFICVNDFPNIETCSKYIIELDNDSKRLAAMLTEPVFANGLPDIFRIGDYSNVSSLYQNISTKLKLALAH
jgi:hypothetical protein